jgi:cell wall-associated NlpC family hydrolase
MRLFVCSLFLTLFFTACSIKNEPSYIESFDTSFPNKAPYNYELTKSLDYEKIYNELLLQYKGWKGVRYKYGGYSKRGIDCSAFVQRTFKDRLNIYVPRTTAMQSVAGKKISREDLEIGDLVFFKTRIKVRHVGIYIGEGKFLHASTKKGVTISRLDNPYYSSHFWKIIRVIK